MRRILSFTTVGWLLLFALPAHATTFVLSGPMDALQAGTNGGFGSFDGTVAGAGDGTGAISGSYDDATNVLDYSITWSDLTSTVIIAHFHVGAVGVSGGIDLGIPDLTSPSEATGIVLSAAQEANLLGGSWYVNIHTTNFPGGEIRGQVNVTAVPEPTSLLLAGATALALAGLRRRTPGDATSPEATLR